MAIALKCPSCDPPLSAPDTAAGKTWRCPKCRVSVSVPASKWYADDFQIAAEPESGPEKGAKDSREERPGLTPDPSQAREAEAASDADRPLSLDDPEPRPRRNPRVVYREPPLSRLFAAILITCGILALIGGLGMDTTVAVDTPSIAGERAFGSSTRFHNIGLLHR